MPVQTPKTSKIYLPDGCKVKAKTSELEPYFDMGATNSACVATLNWTENQTITSNAGRTRKQIRDMIMNGGFTLAHLDQEGIAKMGGGVFTRVVTAGGAVTTCPDKIIPAGWADGIVYPIIVETSSSDSTKLKLTAKPTMTSITLDAGGTPEVLVEGTEYLIISDSNADSGWGITFISAAMSTASPTTLDITLDFASVTAVASEVLYCGSSTALLSAYSIMFEHTDSNGKIRSLELFKVNPDSGGFQFNFKGANEDGIEEMPLTFTAEIDTTRTDGRQLMAWTVEAGAA